jgi:hypothetical protein
MFDDLGRSDDNWKELSSECFAFPMENGAYWLADYSNDIITIPQFHDYKTTDLLIERSLMEDTDTLNVNGKYGLFTLFGHEIIPAVYDSLHLELLVTAYKGNTISLLDYEGKEVISNIKAAYPIYYRYQIIDNNNRMFFMDKQGNKTDTYFYFIMGDDELYPLPYLVLIPPTKESKHHHLVNFIYGNDWEKSRSLMERRKLDGWLKFEIDTIEYYGIDRREYYFSCRDDYYQSEYKIMEIPDEYKDLKLINNRIDSDYRYSSDENLLEPFWVIAKRKGKYGVFDAREPENIILPFEYDKITGLYSLLLLEKKGLKCYYPISNTPRYKVLESFNGNVARFRLRDGRWGWLAKDGKEYFDSEQKLI